MACWWHVGSLENVYTVLSGYVDNPGPKWHSFDSFEQNLKCKYGLELRNTQHYARLDLRQVHGQYNTSVVYQLKSRFPDMGIMSSLCHMFDYHRYPESKADLGNLDTHVDTVLSHFNGMGHGLDNNLASNGRKEWERFSLEMHKRRKEMKTETTTVRKVKGGDGKKLPKPVVSKITTTFCKPVLEILQEFLQNKTNHVEFPYIVLLILIYIVFAVASADAERAFALMKNIKSALRSRMSQALLQQLMHIVLNGPTLEKDSEQEFEDIVELALTYWACKQRRNVIIPGARTAINVKWAETLMRMPWGDIVGKDAVDREKELHKSDDVSVQSLNAS